MASIGLARLCELLPELREVAAEHGRGQEVEELITAATTGTDITTRLGELLRVIDGPSVDERVGLPGLGVRAGAQERYECPHDPLCGRQTQRQPSGPIPECHRDRHEPCNMRQA